MNVDQRILSGSNFFFGLAIASAAYIVLFPFSVLWGFLVPCAVMFAPLLDLHGHSFLGFTTEVTLVAVLVGFGMAGKRRWLVPYLIGVGLYALDGVTAIVIIVRTNGFYIVAGPGFIAILSVIVHAAALIFMVSAATAMVTGRVNAALARDLDVQANLARRLEADVSEPPAPAAKFTHRYRDVPPSAPPPGRAP
ncbi:MAG TPA: hypothetical protein VEJ20_01060 [Candidatus Eremiobacteraceae bacterium]|nr:hypothetical protein [Candidatus Eremiobacteraceae bacterium]